MRNNSYVYVWFRPNGVPLYVGKGTVRLKTQQRWEDHIKYSHNTQLSRVFKKYGRDLPVVLIQEGMSHKGALALEVLLISVIGRADKKAGSLINHTDGGDGVVGFNLTPLQLEQRNESIRRAHADPNTKRRHRDGLINHWADPEKHQQHSEAIKEAQNRPEVKAYRSILSRTMWDGMTPEARVFRIQKTADGNRGKSRTDEQRAHISAGTRAAMAALPEETKQRMVEVTPERRASQSAAAKRRCADTLTIDRFNTPEAIAARQRSYKDPARSAKIAAAKRAYWAEYRRVKAEASTLNVTDFPVQ